MSASQLALRGVATLMAVAVILMLGCCVYFAFGGVTGDLR